MFLTQQQVRDYKTNGFITEIQVTEEDETKRYRELFDQLEAKEGRENCQIVWSTGTLTKNSFGNWRHIHQS